jgi:hypothetical protein
VALNAATGPLLLLPPDKVGVALLKFPYPYGFASQQKFISVFYATLLY